MYRSFTRNSFSGDISVLYISEYTITYSKLQHIFFSPNAVEWLQQRGKIDSSEKILLENIFYLLTPEHWAFSPTLCG